MRVAALGAGGVAMLAANYLCNEMDLGDGGRDYQNGCQQVNGYGLLQVGDSNDFWQPLYPAGSPKYDEGATAVEILETSVFQGQQTGKWVSYVKWRYLNGVTDSADIRNDTQAMAEGVQWRIFPTNGTCERTSDDPSPLPPEIYEPITYVDNTTNCTYTVNLEGFAQTYEGGPFNPVYRVEGQTALRASGGKMGGCNFSPVIYMPNTGGPGGGGGGGGGITFPVPDDEPGPGGDQPWWLTPLLAGLAGAGTGVILNELLGGGGGGGGGGEIEPATFDMIAPCDFTEDGQHQNRLWEFEVPYILPRMVQHQVALMQMLQQHLDWKTPICGGDEPQPIPEGDFRTISFRSDETSPYGKSRLRKRFRYRSVSGNDLGAVVDHWKDFTFEGGPYRVRWVGGTWRAPEIWAASEAEGQRVIQHAAAEAGVSPLEGGRWSTRLSGSGRQGVPGTMRVDTTGGYYWITARDGSDQRPIVAKT